MAPLTRKRAAASQQDEQVSKKRAKATSSNKPKKAKPPPKKAKPPPPVPKIDAGKKLYDAYREYMRKALANAGYLDENRFLPVYADVCETEYAESLLYGKVDGQSEWSHEEWKENLDEFYAQFMTKFSKKQRDRIISYIEEMHKKSHQIPEDERSPAFPYIVDGLTLEGATTMYRVHEIDANWSLAGVLEFIEEYGENGGELGGRTTDDMWSDYFIDLNEELVTIAGDLLWSMDKPNMTMEEMEKMGSAFICLCCPATKEERRAWPELVSHFYDEQRPLPIWQSQGKAVHPHTLTEANKGRAVKISPDPVPAANDIKDEN